jgi:hypothetical protein
MGLCNLSRLMKGEKFTGERLWGWTEGKLDHCWRYNWKIPTASLCIPVSFVPRALCFWSLLCLLYSTGSDPLKGTENKVWLKSWIQQSSMTLCRFSSSESSAEEEPRLGIISVKNRKQDDKRRLVGMP